MDYHNDPEKYEDQIEAYDHIIRNADRLSETHEEVDVEQANADKPNLNQSQSLDLEQNRTVELKPADVSVKTDNALPDVTENTTKSLILGIFLFSCLIVLFYVMRKLSAVENT